MYFRMVFLTLLTIACSNSYVAAALVQSTVKSVYPLSDGSFVIILTNDTSTCPGASPKYFFVTPGQNSMTLDGAKAMLATALTAFAPGSSLALSFDDATTYCYVNRISMQ
jgi:hypothetical protein